MNAKQAKPARRAKPAKRAESGSLPAQEGSADQPRCTGQASPAGQDNSVDQASSVDHEPFADPAQVDEQLKSEKSEKSEQRERPAKRAKSSKRIEKSDAAKPIDAAIPLEAGKPAKRKTSGWSKRARELYDTDEELRIAQRHYEEQAWRPADARPFQSLIANLMVARGYARQQEATAVADAWAAVAGSVAASRSRAGRVFKGVLSVFVDDATLMQELNFRKRKLVEELARRLPDHKIRDVRFKADSKRNG